MTDGEGPTDDTEEDTMPNFTTTEPITVTFDASAANINVTAADRADTVVTVSPTNASRATDVTAAEQTTVEYADGRLRITTPRQPNRPAKLRSVDIDVQLPTGSRLRGETQVGALTARGRLGDCEFTIKAGDITVDEIAAGTIETSAGKIAIGRVTGSAKLTTAQGDIRVIEAVRGEVTAHTSYGHLDIGVARSTAVTMLTTNTSMGTVRNGLGADARSADPTDQVAIDLRTWYGDVTVRNAHRDPAPVHA